jgi:DDE superfamily endonuclease
VSYEIAVGLVDSKIAWINGPFRAGLSDLHIFNAEHGLGEKLPLGKKVIVDRAYKGNDEVLSKKNEFDQEAVKTFKRRARGRHESLNKKLKDFSILDHRFRHTLNQHKSVFEAVAIIVQYEMDNGAKLFCI